MFGFLRLITPASALASLVAYENRTEKWTLDILSAALIGQRGGIFLISEFSAWTVIASETE